MTKLCPRGKAAAKRKFKVYPSAYANAYASKICAGKIKDPSGVKRKDFRGSKASGGRAGFKGGGADSGRIGQLKSDLQTAKNKSERIAAVKKAEKDFRRQPNKNISKGQGFQMGPKTFFVGKEDPRLRKGSFGTGKKNLGKRKPFKTIDKILQEQTKGPTEVSRKNRAGGGLMEATARLKRQGLRGGGICKKGMNRQAVGKNS